MENPQPSSNQTMSGLIYMIKSPSDKHYIGQTTQTFANRMTRHKSAANDLSKTDGCRALNNAIRKYGWENMEKEILEENIETDQLDEKEVFYIEKYNSLAPTGYNLMSGGNSNKVMSEETKQLQHDSAMARDSTPYRKNPETLSYPKYVGISNGWPRISKHPKCSCKTFSDKSKTFEENLEDALAFLEKLNSGEEEVIIPPRELPKGIQHVGEEGYRVHIKIEGNTYTRNFTDLKFSEKKNLEMAEKYLAEVSALYNDIKN